MIYDEVRGTFRWYFADEAHATPLPTTTGARWEAITPASEPRPDPWALTPYEQYRDVLARCEEQPASPAAPHAPRRSSVQDRRGAVSAGGGSRA